jgi:hypothetical protein
VSTDDACVIASRTTRSSKGTEPLGYATNYDEVITLPNGEPNPNRRRPFTDKQLAQLYYENLVVALRAMVER